MITGTRSGLGEEGIAAAMYGFLRHFGMAIGVGVDCSAFQNIMSLKLRRDGLPTGIAAQSESFVTELLGLPDSAFKSRVLEAYVFGFRGVFAVYAAISGLALLSDLSAGERGQAAPSSPVASSDTSISPRDYNGPVTRCC